MSSVLDLLIKGKTVNENIIELISDTPFADLSSYKNRSKIWEAINYPQKERYLEVTTQSVLKYLLEGTINSKTIKIRKY